MHDRDIEINLFVPGRICLVGELSDLTSEYITQNRNIIPGKAIAMGLDNGIYVTAKKCKKLVFHMDEHSFECSIDEETLKKEALSESFYSYICGLVLHFYRKYGVYGISICIKYNTLPIKKGLSSSAAICVAIAKAYNQLYNLNLNDNELMQDAYYGEHLALSKCGKLDQIIVKGNTRLSKMTFYEDCVSVQPIQVKKELNLVIADLGGNKDTRKILNALRECYPIAKTKEQEKVHNLFGIENEKFTNRMKEALEEGNIEEVGKIFNDTQELIDKVCIPICDEYKAPKLHKVMNDKTIKELSFGSRGIGAGGDGSIQILAKDKLSQEKIINYIEEELNLDTFKYDIKVTHKVKKAIIPVAGFGTRLYPLSRSVKKSFMPISDGDTMKPIILKLVEELDEAGIEEICLVIGPDDKEQYDSFFKKSLQENHLKGLDEKNKEYEFNILRIGEKIKYVVQEEQKGFGHAINLCKEFANNEPVLIMLGDTYYTSKEKTSCIEQMLNYYDENAKNIIAIGEIDDEEIENVGIVSGVFNEENKMSVRKIVEKPKKEYAKEHLISEDGKCYGNFGMWIINKYIFKQLEENIKEEITTGGEYGFVEAIEELVDDMDIKALKINGSSHDVGNMTTYKKTLVSTILYNDIKNINLDGSIDIEKLKKIKDILEDNK